MNSQTNSNKKKKFIGNRLNKEVAYTCQFFNFVMDDFRHLSKVIIFVTPVTDDGMIKSSNAQHTHPKEFQLFSTLFLPIPASSCWQRFPSDTHTNTLRLISLKSFWKPLLHMSIILSNKIKSFFS